MGLKVSRNYDVELAQIHFIRHRLTKTYEILDRVRHVADEMRLRLSMEVDEVQPLGRVWTPHVNKLFVPGDKGTRVWVPNYSVDFLALMTLVGRPKSEAVV